MTTIKKILCLVLAIIMCFGIIGASVYTNKIDANADFDYSQLTLNKTLLNGRLKLYKTKNTVLPYYLQYAHVRLTYGWQSSIKTLSGASSDKASARWYSLTEVMPHYYTLDGEVAYCFDLTTADVNDTYQVFNSLSAAGVPTNNRSHAEMMKVAIAAYMWTRNNFELMKTDDSWIWDSIKSTYLVNYNSNINFTRENFYNTAKSNDYFLRAMVQYMIWNYMNGTYYNLDGSIRWRGRETSSNVYYETGTTTSEGHYERDKEGNLIWYDGHTLVNRVGLHAYIDFMGMVDYAYDLYIQEEQESNWYWQNEWSFRPGETKTITDANVISYLDRIYAAYGYIGSSTSKITYTKNSATSATLTAATDAPTHDWYNWQKDISTENMIVSSPNYSSVTGGSTGGQLIIKVGDVNKIRIRVKVENPETYVQITKTAPTGFSATGAKFGLYASQADATNDRNRITTLTIGSNGKTEAYKYTMSGTSATLYAKEISAPTQTGDFAWIMDTSVKSVTLTNANTASNPGTISFTNNVRQYAYIKVKKTVPTGYSAQGATFGVYGSQSDATNNTNRLTTLTIGSNGESGTYKITLPDGINKSKTIYIKELTAPTQSGDFDWVLDTSVKSYNVTASNTSTAPYVFNISNDVNEYSYLQIIKTAPNGYKAQGATFGVYASEANARSNTNKLTTLTIGADGKSGTYRFKLPQGVSKTSTLYVKELTPPTQSGDFDWVVDSSIKSVVMSKTASSSPKTVTFNNDVIEYAYLTVKKTVPNGYSAQGATFGVYASAANANSDTNRLHLFTIGSDGKATTTYRTALPQGVSKNITLYVKELTKPTQSGNFDWKIDSNVKTITLTSANTSNSPGIVTVNNTVQEYGYAEVIKTAPDGYNPTGAEYTIYTDAACTTPATASIFASGTVEKFTISSSGKSNQIKFNVPTGGSLTIYVKETKKPTQAEVGFDWNMDTTKYKMTMTIANTASNPIRVNSANDVTEYGYGYITKISDVVSKQALVDGAQFTVYNSDGTVAKDYKTGENVVLTVENGKTSTFCLVVGTYTLKETRVPAEFDKADDRTITIEKNKTIEFKVTNHYQKAEVYVLKTTDREDMLSKYPLVGTKIGVYTDPACTTLAVDVLTGEQCILTVQSNMKTNKVTLGLATYYFKEISTTEWYDLNTDAVSLKMTEDGKTYEVKYINHLKKGLGQVEKGFR